MSESPGDAGREPRDDDDHGGEAPCWAHLVADLSDDRDPAAGPAVVDLTSMVDDQGRGAIWSLPHGGDLDANVVRLPSGEEIGEHVNDAVDVLMVVWSGVGEIEVGGARTTLSPGVVVGVERGSRRRIVAGASDLVYLSVHRRRDPLTVRGHPAR